LALDQFAVGLDLLKLVKDELVLLGYLAKDLSTLLVLFGDDPVHVNQVLVIQRAA